MALSTQTFPLRIIPFKDQVKRWPSSGKHILAQFDQNSIVVYQAYNDKIANAILKENNFHSEEASKAGYNMGRMSWIKTNFLWMMYRSGWASKENQTRILGITISRIGFEEILLNSATKSFGCVRLQWDPDHGPTGDKVMERRAIQLGLRGEMLEKFSREFIISICDATEFVNEQAKHVSDSCELLMMPEEAVYVCLNEKAAENVGLSKL